MLLPNYQKEKKKESEAGIFCKAKVLKTFEPTIVYFKYKFQFLILFEMIRNYHWYLFNENGLLILTAVIFPDFDLSILIQYQIVT